MIEPFVSNAMRSELQSLAVQVLFARSKLEIASACERLIKASVLGCDTETSGLSAKYGKLHSIQFSDGEFNVLVPLSEGAEMGSFSDLLVNPTITKVFHNAKFDLEFLHAAGYRIANVFDTMIAEKLLTRGANQSASLAETLYRYFAIDLDKSQRAKFTKKWDGVWTEDLINYALSDVIHLPRLMREQTAWLEKLDLCSEYAVQIAKLRAA
jgi:ribonuclease D